MCIVQDPDWDISLPSLTYQEFTSKLSAHLKGTNHFTANSLSKGRGNASTVAVSSNQAKLFDKYGDVATNDGESGHQTRHFLILNALYDAMRRVYGRTAARCGGSRRTAPSTATTGRI